MAVMIRVMRAVPGSGRDRDLPTSSSSPAVRRRFARRTAWPGGLHRNAWRVRDSEAAPPRPPGHGLGERRGPGGRGGAAPLAARRDSDDSDRPPRRRTAPRSDAAASAPPGGVGDGGRRPRRLHQGRRTRAGRHGYAPKSDGPPTCDKKTRLDIDPNARFPGAVAAAAAAAGGAGCAPDGPPAAFACIACRLPMQAGILG